MLLATLVMAAAFNITAFAGEWKQNDIGWWYQKCKQDGSTNYSNWVPFIYSNDNELKQGISSGNVIYTDGHYLASPDYANARTIENEIINKYTVGSKLSEDYTVVPHHEEEIFYYDPDGQYDDLDGIVDVY